MSDTMRNAYYLRNYYYPDVEGTETLDGRFVELPPAPPVLMDIGGTILYRWEHRYPVPIDIFVREASYPNPCVYCGVRFVVGYSLVYDTGLRGVRGGRHFAHVGCESESASDVGCESETTSASARGEGVGPV